MERFFDSKITNICLFMFFPPTKMAKLGSFLKGCDFAPNQQNHKVVINIKSPGAGLVISRRFMHWEIFVGTLEFAKVILIYTSVIFVCEIL